LTPYARNSRTHSPQQIKQIAASIKEFGFINPIIVDDTNTIIAGHGRLAAAEHLQLETVPCVRVEHMTETQRRAYVIADNKLALNAGWDEELLKIELDSLHEDGFNLEIAGFDANELSAAMGLDDAAKESLDANPYSQKIASPVYEMTGEKPRITDLYDDGKYKELVESINSAKIDSEQKQFLIAAASRHIVFNYAQIAEYYAHSSAECQELMENSALVIIDYKKAIEQGLVKITKDIEELYGKTLDEE
jgi:hypothetical protein